VRGGTRKAGAAPATVRDEAAVTTGHWRGVSRREGAAAEDPEPGDLSAAERQWSSGGGCGVIRSAASSLPNITLVLGGARSGKSAHAERLVETAAAGGVYVATAEAGDGEMAERIRRHRARRGPAWTTVEEPIELAAALSTHAAPDRPVLVDCLTLWLSNVMAAARDVAREREQLLAALAAVAGPVVFVSNELGLGLVPATPLGRAFRDEAGWLNQAVAAAAGRVVFVAAGIPLTIKEEETRR
jgi:adenosylcobinamide kinase / adenosylcobinamide-phosphate guanylyltransferase